MRLGALVSSHMFLAMLFDTTLVAICCYALIRGGRPERMGAVINLSASALTSALRLLDVGYLAPAESVILSIDLVVAISFYWLGITTIRFWPIWAAGFALADLFTSLIGGLLPHIRLFAYHSGLGIYAYLALGALALATSRLPRDAEPYLRNGSRQSWLQHMKETN
jgi:hypothetical protein